MTPGIEAFADDGSDLEREEIVLGRGAGAAGRTFVALHGLGDTPGAFGEHVRGIATDARVVVLRAPVAHDAGYAWFPYRGVETTLAEVTRWSAVALPRVERCVEAIAGESRGRLHVLGFSQGAVLSYALAARRPELLARCLAIAGVLCAEPAAHAPHRPSVTALHGSEDPAAPVALGEASVARLRAAGYDANLVVRTSVSHAVTASLAEVLRAWVCEGG